MTFAFAKAGGSIDPKYYENDKSARVYLNNTLTISATKISKVEFTFSTGKTGTFTCDKNGYTDTNSSGTWTGDASSLTFTVSAGQKRITTVKITAPSFTEDAGDFAGGSSEGDYTVGWPSAADVKDHYGVEIAIPVLTGYEEKAYWEFYPEDEDYYQSFDIYVDNEDISDQYIALLTNETNKYVKEELSFEYEGEVYVLGEYYCDPTNTLAISVDYYDSSYEWTGTYIGVYFYDDVLGGSGDDTGGDDDVEYTAGWPSAADVKDHYGVEIAIPVLTGYEEKAEWYFWPEDDSDFQSFEIWVDGEDVTEAYIALLTNDTNGYTVESDSAYDYYCDQTKTIAISVTYLSEAAGDSYTGTEILVYLYSDVFAE